MSKGPAIGDWTQYGWIPDDVSSFPARIRLRNAAWMVYYEPNIVVQQERDEMLELQAENAKLRELVKEALMANKGGTFWEYFDPYSFWAGWCKDAHELGIEVDG